MSSRGIARGLGAEGNVPAEATVTSSTEVCAQSGPAEGCHLKPVGIENPLGDQLLDIRIPSRISWLFLNIKQQ